MGCAVSIGVMHSGKFVVGIAGLALHVHVDTPERSDAESSVASYA